MSKPDRDEHGVVLQNLVASFKKMVDRAEGATPDERLANILGCVIAAAALGPERSRAACMEALALQGEGRIGTLLRRAQSTPRH